MLLLYLNDEQLNTSAPPMNFSCYLVPEQGHLGNDYRLYCSVVNYYVIIASSIQLILSGKQ